MAEATLVEQLARAAPSDGVHAAPFEGVRFFRLERPVTRLPAVYPRSLCVIVQGAKRAYVGGKVLTYDASHYLCATMPVPVEAELPHASPRDPVLGLLVDLESQIAVETTLAFDASNPGRADSECEPGLAAVGWSPEFRGALQRMFQLLGDTLALRMLGEGRLRELLFAVLRGEAGPAIRRSCTRDPLLEVIRLIRERLHEALDIGALAQRAGMSRAVFDRRFKMATGHSPLQFIKALRLHEAAMLLSRGLTVAEAADRVGYSSSSHFSREFRRQFGASPRDWVRSDRGFPGE